MDNSQNKNFEKVNNSGNGAFDKRKKGGFFSFSHTGIILAFLLSISDRLSTKLRNGFFGQIFSSLYVKENRMFKDGFLTDAFGNYRPRGSQKKLSLKNKFAKIYENSLFFNKVSSVAFNVVNTYVRLWGIYLFVFSFVTILVMILKFFFEHTIDNENLIYGVVIGIVSVPLLISNKRLGDALKGGIISRYVLITLLGLDELKLEADEEKSGGDFSLAVIISSSLGLLTYFVSPLLLIVMALFMILFSIIMSFPEFGVLLTLGSIPFTSIFDNPSIVVLSFLSLSIFSFFFKYIRGKRVIHFELVDMFIAIFGAMIIFGGVVTSGGRASLKSALLYFAFLMIHFLIVNTFTRKTLIYKAIKLIVFTTTITSLVGIFEEGIVSSSWVDMSAFGDMGARVSSFLGNPNMLGIYLIIAFPLILAEIIIKEKPSLRLLYSICTAVVVACIIMTYSRGAWLGLIVATITFLISYNIKNLWIAVLAFVSAPIWSLLIPDSIINRFISIFALSDSSSTYRIYTWRGVWAMLKDYALTGIGVGQDAFASVYPQYAFAGTESVPHSHNLFLQIAIELGVAGLVVFLIIMFMYMQKCFSNINIKNHKSKSRVVIAACFAGIVGALSMGLTDYIWYNYRVFLMFWVVLSLSCAMIRINDKQLIKENANVVNNVRNVDVDIYF